MLKITIILLLLAIASTFILKVLAFGLSSDEKLNVVLFNKYPTRLCIMAAILCLSYIATFICIIITVITW